MKPFGAENYVPVLLTKAGELSALKELQNDSHRESSSRDKDRFTPLFVVHPIDWDYEEDQLKTSVDVHVEKLSPKLVKAWGTRPAFIDAVNIDGQILNDGRHPIVALVEEAANDSLELVPVISPNYTDDYKQAVIQLCSGAENAEVAFRLRVPDWPIGDSSLDVDLFLDEIGVAAEQVHLILDLGSDTSESALYLLRAALKNLAHAEKWKTVSVVASAMPTSLPSGKGIHRIIRQEWTNYIVATSGLGVDHRVPTFGDYAIASADPFEDIDPRIVQISAKLKYATGGAWLVARGDLFKGHGGRSKGGEAIRPAARAVAAHSEFDLGTTGVEEWIRAAAVSGPAGSPQIWVRIGTWRHIIRVIDLVSAQQASFAS